MSIVGKLGSVVIRKSSSFLHTVGVMTGVCYLATNPRYWSKPVRTQVARQILFTGVEAMGLVIMVALLVGVSVVAQAQYWLSEFGQSEMLGKLLVGVIIREVGPILVCLIVIGRSGTAIATELANMRVNAEVTLLDSQGIDPMVYLVMPRVVGMMVSIFCLTLLFVVASFVSGFIVGFVLDVSQGDPRLFAESVLGSIMPRDIFNFIAKTILPGLIIGTICCMEGLSISGEVTQVPQAATRAVVRSIVMTLIVSAVVSVLTYV